MSCSASFEKSWTFSCMKASIFSWAASQLLQELLVLLVPVVHRLLGQRRGLVEDALLLLHELLEGFVELLVGLLFGLQVAALAGRRAGWRARGGIEQRQQAFQGRDDPALARLQIGAELATAVWRPSSAMDRAARSTASLAGLYGQHQQRLLDDLGVLVELEGLGGLLHQLRAGRSARRRSWPCQCLVGPASRPRSCSCRSCCCLEQFHERLRGACRSFPFPPWRSAGGRGT